MTMTMTTSWPCVRAAETAFLMHAYMHEVGHNLWLQHGFKNGQEYNDDSAVMAYCCDTRCHNAAHMWQASSCRERGGAQGARCCLPAGPQGAWATCDHHTLCHLLPPLERDRARAEKYACQLALACMHGL